MEPAEHVVGCAVGRGRSHRRAGVVRLGVVEVTRELPDDAEHVVETGGVDVLGAERGLAARERVEQRRPRGRAITRRQQRLAAQALELHAEAVERIARGQGLGEPLRAIEHVQRAGVIAGAQQR